MLSFPEKNSRAAWWFLSRQVYVLSLKWSVSFQRQITSSHFLKCYLVTVKRQWKEKKMQLKHQTGNKENWVPFVSLIDLLCDPSMTSLYDHFPGYVDQKLSNMHFLILKVCALHAEIEKIIKSENKRAETASRITLYPWILPLQNICLFNWGISRS